MTYRILIVDDDITFTRQVKLLLERSGRFEVKEENHGLRGLAAARAFQPDIILLDVCMPDMDGGDLAAQLRGDREFCNTPIAFLTSLVDANETGTHPKLSGGFHFIGKPVNGRRLAECLSVILAANNCAPA